MLWSCWERLSERSSGEFQAVVLLEKTVLELYIERPYGFREIKGSPCWIWGETIPAILGCGDAERTVQVMLETCLGSARKRASRC